jgi:cation:H+ antiporter
VTAVRLGAIDLALGNVLGSNLINIAILAVFDIAYRRGSLWATLSQAHALAGLFVMIMTGAVMVSLVYRVSAKTPYRFSWDGTALLVMYGVAMAVLFTYR